jgi:chromosome segregation ATPase
MKETVTLIGFLVVILAIGIVGLFDPEEPAPEIPDYTNSLEAIVDDADEIKRDLATLERNIRTTDISGLDSKLNSLATAISGIQNAINLQGQKIASLDSKLTDIDKSSGSNELTVRLPTSQINNGESLVLSGTCGARERVDAELEHQTVRVGNYRFTESETADADGDWDIRLRTDDNMPDGRYILTIECDNDDKTYSIEVD